MDEKKLRAKSNKALEPDENKGAETPGEPKAPEETKATEGPKTRVRFKPGRAAAGVAMDENGEAVVEYDLAMYLVSINYADVVE